MKTPLSVFAKREWAFTGENPETGKEEEQVLTIYTAFTPAGDAIDFTSTNDAHKIFKVFKFSPEYSEEIDLEVKAFMGKVKYREAGSIFFKGGGSV